MARRGYRNVLYSKAGKLQDKKGQGAEMSFAEAGYDRERPRQKVTRVIPGMGYSNVLNSEAV